MTPPPTAAAPPPPCPITGRPAKRLVHGVAAETLRRIWRHGQGIDVSGLFAGVERLTLWESDTGLVFFEPKIVGDGDFYRDYYRRWDFHDRLAASADARVDYRTAASFVPEGAEVVDVGSGSGAFRRHLPHARYVGLDPYAEADSEAVRETLEVHADRNPGRYDVATAFHVIEHVSDPLLHAELMAKLLRPGGLLILAAPLHPSLLTEIPNLPINIPPHHVTWWNPGAFSALARQVGLEVVEATTLPPSPYQGIILWLRRLLLARTDPAPHERYVAHRWAWHAALALAFPLASLATRLRALPPDPRHVDAFLVARKPGGAAKSTKVGAARA